MCALARDSHGVATVVQYFRCFLRNLILLSIDFCQVFSYCLLDAASLLWNSLPPDIQSSPLPAFRQHLNTFIYRQSFPDIVIL